MPKSKMKSERPKNGESAGLEAKLWAAADALRNNMDAAEYKHVILGLIFIKYISDAFEAKHAELQPQKKDGADPEDRILGTLDDKINLNRRMNETLEAMTQALFKSWLVDFDPVRAKAAGRDHGLPMPIADLFPECFEDSEMGEISKGWGVGMPEFTKPTHSLLCATRFCQSSSLESCGLRMRNGS